VAPENTGSYFEYQSRKFDDAFHFTKCKGKSRMTSNSKPKAGKYDVT
jgi:hypothetical protein